jgi:hypothetical protein
MARARWKRKGFTSVPPVCFNLSACLGSYLSIFARKVSPLRAGGGGGRPVRVNLPPPPSALRRPKVRLGEWSPSHRCAGEAESKEKRPALAGAGLRRSREVYRY